MGTSVCDLPAVDAHHILERRLFHEPFENAGYFLENGASVCSFHHLECEMTHISVEDVRLACGVTKPVIPDHLYEDPMDKWGNPILANGQRLRGELFFDESVQKILAEGKVLDLFTNKVKFPRTHHLPWSEGMHDDDRMHKTLKHFEGKRVIVTRKMDGENTSCYNDYIHARSIDGRHHASRNWIKNFWATFAQDIPQDWRVCGENLYAKHSIVYDDLPSYFLGFSVWNEKNVCLSWDDTVLWFHLLGISPVDVLYDGIYDEKKVRACYSPENWTTCEGYVMRLADEFSYGQFRTSVGKFVRANHIATTKHWMHGQQIIPNKLKTI